MKTIINCVFWFHSGVLSVDFYPYEYNQTCIIIVYIIDFVSCLNSNIQEFISKESNCQLNILHIISYMLMRAPHTRVHWHWNRHQLTDCDLQFLFIHWCSRSLSIIRSNNIYFFHFIVWLPLPEYVTSPCRVTQNKVSTKKERKTGMTNVKVTCDLYLINKFRSSEMEYRNNRKRYLKWAPSMCLLLRIIIIIMNEWMKISMW